MKKLVRISDGRLVCGVCAGIAQYLEVDVTVVRLITALLSMGGGIGIWGYIIAAFIIPKSEDWVDQ